MFLKRHNNPIIVTILGLSTIGISVAGMEQAISAPAPALSQVKVIGVNRVPQLCVQTQEVGYGTNQIAQFNGNRLTERSSAPTLGAGRVVTGWTRVWCYQGSFTSGTFTFQATSINFPRNTLSTRLYIR
ncbi:MULTISPECIES: DUF4879 domain-containing protein [Nostocales]|jgi:hypothetical protein|uniref:DUF4879 domain-containing protein n=1 Tax=Aphanizomenon flos-aquae FACHB-1040 TaxID=2692887 RepID=A0ABR8BZR5_APHFL|nr:MULTISPECIES: DUF4879 domain-containing protein [Nostocales]MBD2279306.1 DUF4879 domain-containing protein [Aphanizomenon flos-aquae FACHB-1040]